MQTNANKFIPPFPGDSAFNFINFVNVFNAFLHILHYDARSVTACLIIWFILIISLRMTAMGHDIPLVRVSRAQFLNDGECDIGCPWEEKVPRCTLAAK